jgi:hypothetical protein
VADRNALWSGTTADRKVGTEDARLGTGALLTPGTSAVNTRSGLRPGPGNPGLVAATGTPGPNVTANAFQGTAVLAARPGPYVVTTDAQATIPILDVPAHASLQRNDLIIAQVRDASYAPDVDRVYVVRRIQGTPGSGDPAITDGPNYITLARVRVTAGATTITTPMIDDLRPGWISALGGLLPIRTLAERDALTVYPGFPIYRLDKAWTEIHDGTAWRVQGQVVTAALADITHPVAEQTCILSTDKMIYKWTGAAWVGIAGTDGSSATFRHEARYYQSTLQTIPNATDRRLLFNNNEYLSNDITSATVGSGTEFTVVRPGVYDLSACVALNGNAGGGERFFAIAGAGMVDRYAAMGLFPGGGLAHLGAATTRRFAANDKLCAMVFQNCTANLDTLPSVQVHFSATWRRP